MSKTATQLYKEKLKEEAYYYLKLAEKKALKEAKMRIRGKKGLFSLDIG